MLTTARYSRRFGLCAAPCCPYGPGAPPPRRAPSGADGYITTRDLLKWAARRPSDAASAAAEGYMLLAERLRHADERAEVRTVLEQELGGSGTGNATARATAAVIKAALADEALYYSAQNMTRVRSLLADAESFSQSSGSGGSGSGGTTAASASAGAEGTATTSVGTAMGDVKEVDDDADDAAAAARAGLRGVAPTRSLARLLVLVGRCIDAKEPVLLVGETGGGKTTVCQVSHAERWSHLSRFR